ncbi:hypothetical protein NSQ54_05250 [Alkalihalobacillus sp. FSL W8-0930]
MKKKLLNLGLAGALVSTFSLTPYAATTASAANNSEEEIIVPVEDDNVVETQGKATITIKAAKELIEKNKTKIDNAIEKAIYAIPGLSDENKKKWAGTITAVGIAKYLGEVTGAADTAEDAVTDYLTDTLGVPSVVATPVVKTVFFIVL